MLRDRASSDESPTDVPSFTDPRRLIAPVAKRKLSRRVVLPLR